MSLWGLAGGGSIIFLRVFRAFRVMRLFKKLQPMRKILISLGACVKPVTSAFVILFILASVYAQVRLGDPPRRRDARSRDAWCPSAVVISPRLTHQSYSSIQNSARAVSPRQWQMRPLLVHYC